MLRPGFEWLVAVLLAALVLPAQAAGPGGENAVDLSAYPTRAEVVATMQQAVPVPSTQTPPPAALDSVQGTGTTYARADHTHAVRVQRTVLTTAADGTATWTFARPIAVAAGKLPPVAYMVEDTGSPVVVQVVGRAMTSDGTTDTHTAVTIKAQRSRTLPATILTLAALVSFDIFGLPATGTKVNLFAADPTQ